MRQLRETADEYGKVIYASASIHRADVAECLDGFFHEGGFYGPNLNMNAFLAVFRPLSVWSHPTEIFDRNGDKWLRIELFSGKKIEEPAHTFFQRHLLMGAWPMAPLWNNDHSVQPSPGLVELYREHLPLFRCIEGRKWILSHNAVTCSHPDVETNIFRVKQGYAVPLASTDGSECILNFQLAGDQPRFAKLIVAGGGYIPLDLETHATGLTVKVAPPTNTASIVLLFQTETSLRNRLLQTFQNHPAPTLKWIP